MHCYAELDETGRCKAVINAGWPIDAPTMVSIPACDDSYIGRWWVAGDWQDEAP